MAERVLFELGVEEVPAGFLSGREGELEGLLETLADRYRFSYSQVKVFLTPRRLAFVIEDLAETVKETVEEKKGPPVSIARTKDGGFAKPALAFAESSGVEPEELIERETGKGTYLFAKVKKGGGPVRDALPGFADDWVVGIPFVKQMRWENYDKPFPRPVRWIVFLYGDEIIPLTLFGVESGRKSQAARFGNCREIEIVSAREYPACLERGSVIADSVRRKEIIRSEVRKVGKKLDADALDDDRLLDEISFLVEYPVPIVCSIDDRFLELPDVVLVTSMKHHQKFLPFRDRSGKVRKEFVGVGNVIEDTEGHIRRGYERVLTARLADAEFFFKEDISRPFESYRDSLRNMLFLADRGSMWDKEERLKRIGQGLGEMLDLDKSGLARLERGAVLCKNDLATQMVYEFPDLQGTMGEIYALRSGEEPETAAACREHYLPLQVNDPVPNSLTGRVLALADKIDTIVAAFSLGKTPTGSRDPLGIRRAAIGIIRILDEARLELSLRGFIECAVNVSAEEFEFDKEKVIHEVADYLIERVAVFWSEREGIPIDIVRAGVELEFETVSELRQRIDAIDEFRKQGHFTDLTTSFKRVINIQKGVEGIDGTVDPHLFSDDAERTLFETTEKLETEADQCFAERQYACLLDRFAAVKPHVDRFFDEVLVMAPDERVQKNRLNLLRRLSNVFLRIIDFSKIQTS